MKKFSALLLAIVMCLGMTSAAWAEVPSEKKNGRNLGLGKNWGKGWIYVFHCRDSMCGVE